MAKRRTNRKSRRSIKRSIKRDFEKSLRKTIERSIKKSLNKFTKRNKKRKKKKTKKKKIQRGGAQGGEEIVPLIIQSLEHLLLKQNKGSVGKKLKNSLGRMTGFENPDIEGASTRRSNSDHNTNAYKIYKKTLSEINDPANLTLLYYVQTIIMIIEANMGVIPENIKDLFMELLSVEEFNKIYIPFILYIFGNVYKNQSQNREVLKELMETPQFIEYFKSLAGVSGTADVIHLIDTKLGELGDGLKGATEKVRQLLIDRGIFNIVELAKTGEPEPVAEQAAAAAAAADADPEQAAVVVPEVVEEPAAVVPQEEEEEEECTLSEKVAELARKLDDCKAMEVKNAAELEGARAEIEQKTKAISDAEQKVAKTRDELEISNARVNELEAQLSAASALVSEGDDAKQQQQQQAAAAAAAAAARVEELTAALDAEILINQQLNIDLKSAQAAVEEATAALAETQEMASRIEVSSKKENDRLRAEMAELDLQITNLLKERACSILAEIIIDCKLIEVREAEGAAAAAAEGGAAAAGPAAGGGVLDKDKYGLPGGTSLKFIKKAVKEIAKALKYGVEVINLYKGVSIDSEERAGIHKVIDALLNYIYKNNAPLIQSVKGKIPDDLVDPDPE